MTNRSNTAVFVAGVAYITGDRSLETSATDPDNRVFRRRNGRLGDIVNAAPVAVNAPPYRYSDTGYATFAAANAERKRVVYVAANDGLQHAFAAGTTTSRTTPDSTAGIELWAFAPSAALPNLWRVADTAFDDQHRFLLDAYDVAAGRWRSILVGAMGKGGRSYYALDVTDPDAPAVLWEVSTGTSGFGELGLTYGTPLITQLKDGTWVVIATSGVDNVSPGDGVGRVYVINAVTGALIRTVSTGAGSTATPANLIRLNGWIDSDQHNQALRLYGGDMLGNIWRIDHDDWVAPAGNEATLLGIATSPNDARQPITTTPMLLEAYAGGRTRVLIAVGTGRLLGSTDLGDASVQSLYVIQDTLNAVAQDRTSLYGVLRSPTAALVQQGQATDLQVTTPATIDWSTQNGWYVDFERNTRERFAIDPVFISQSRASFLSSIPGGSECQSAGSSYLYDVNALTGRVEKTAAYSQIGVGQTGIVADNQLRSPSATTIVTLDDQSVSVVRRGPLAGPAALVAKRASWREIVD